MRHVPRRRPKNEPDHKWSSPGSNPRVAAVRGRQTRPSRAALRPDRHRQRAVDDRKAQGKGTSAKSRSHPAHERARYLRRAGPRRHVHRHRPVDEHARPPGGRAQEQQAGPSTQGLEVPKAGAYPNLKTKSV